MQKKLHLLVCVFAACTCMAHAQIERGNVLIGANIANFQFGLREGNHFEVLINPKAAWFVQDNVALGGYLTLGLSTDKGAGTDFSYGVGALARLYTGAAATALHQTRVFVEANAGIEGFNPRAGDNTNGLGLGVGPGISYFVTRNIGLEGLVKYNGIIGFGTATTNHLLSLNVGFQIYLPGRTVKAAAEDLK